MKSQGLFDQFRRECLADVDTKPAYQNLQQRVESSVASFLSDQMWTSELNKNQLREKLRKNITEYSIPIQYTYITDYRYTSYYTINI